MKIQVVSGVGTGPTTLSAFDSALVHAGVANYNLIYLSSVIPPKSKIVPCTKSELKLTGDWGDKLFVVLAQERIDTPNIEAWAGIGWVQDPETGKGLFVEHHGNSEHTVARDIEDSLTKLMHSRNMSGLTIHKSIIGAMCEKEPICALVVAIYESEPWVNMIK